MAPTSGIVLVVDDDQDIRAALRDVLGDHGFLVLEAGSGQQARDRIAEQVPDVILLDLGLPDASGLDVLSELTSAGPTPVIVLSNRSGETDRVVGLDLGADDYISKPFPARELIARINATLRRRRDSTPELVFGDLVVAECTHEVTLAGRQVELTPREFELLVFLARSPRRVYNRAQILREVWGSTDRWQDDNTVAEHVYRIRRKLDADDRNRWIQTVRGVGYRFDPSPD